MWYLVLEVLRGTALCLRIQEVMSILSRLVYDFWKSQPGKEPMTLILQGRSSLPV